MLLIKMEDSDFDLIEPYDREYVEPVDFDYLLPSDDAFDDSSINKIVTTPTGVKRHRAHGEIQTDQTESGGSISPSSYVKTLGGPQERDMYIETLSEASGITMPSSISAEESKYRRKRVSKSVVEVLTPWTGLEAPDDGFSWRKYGQKDILGSVYQRYYYRCTYRHSMKCWAVKQVQRSDDGSSLKVYYRGMHSCGRHLESSYQKPFPLLLQNQPTMKIARIFRRVYTVVKAIRAMITLSQENKNRGITHREEASKKAKLLQILESSKKARVSTTFPREKVSVSTVISRKTDEAMALMLSRKKLQNFLAKKANISKNLKLEDLFDCLAGFCSLLPSTYEFDKDKMIQLLVAQGFFDLESGQNMEVVANEHFDHMFEKNFILQSRFDMTKGKMKYKVNNVVSKSPYLRVKEDELSSISEDVQHLLVLSQNFDLATFKTLKRFNQLQTLILFCQHGDSIKRVPYDLFPRLQHLKTLDLHGTNISELPDSISYLSFLRFLDVSETPLRLLPESIGSLRHLQTLKLESCFNFFRLPHCTSKLVNLRHLELDILGQLTSLPVGMGNLIHLQTLKAFILGKGEGSGARELKHLTDLCGSFCISRLENISSSEEAGEAEIRSKKHISKLELRWEVHQDDLALLDEIFECLQPYSNLKELQISFYNGSRFPIWMSNSYLSNIVSITLYECKSCGYLPSLGGLQSLKSLVIFEMFGVRSIDHQFCRYEGSQTGPAFPKLEKLRIDGMGNLEQWTGVEDGDFPCLLQLSIGRCPKLIVLPTLSLFSYLQVFEICQCDALVSFPEGKLPSKLEFLVIIDCPLMKEHCIKPQGEEWSKIEHIPSIFIDHEEMSSS